MFIFSWHSMVLKISERNLNYLWRVSYLNDKTDSTNPFKVFVPMRINSVTLIQQIWLVVIWWARWLKWVNQSFHLHPYYNDPNVLIMALHCFNVKTITFTPKILYVGESVHIDWLGHLNYLRTYIVPHSVLKLNFWQVFNYYLR